jgi:glutamate-5-semialdehyde dehydrogenase
MDLKNDLKKAKDASRIIAKLSAEEKNKALKKIAEILRKNMFEIIEANEIDMENGEEKGLGAMLDRLKLTEERIEAICKDLENVISLEDYVGKIIDESKRPNCLKITRVRVPIGVIGIIYEARPNVTIDAASLCLKSGNSVVLRGGSDAINTNRILVKFIKQALKESKLPEDAVTFIDSQDREAVKELLKMRDYIDVIIPRGGKGLIDMVIENSTIPVIETGASVVHLYVDKDADIKKAVDCTMNSKLRRVSICNALDTLLVHKDIAEKFLPLLTENLLKIDHPIEIRADIHAHKILDGKFSRLTFAEAEDYHTEFLDYILAVKVVENLDEAIDHIDKHSLKHTESIITEDKKSAEKFLNEVDASCVYVNASTQFSDGTQFGLGAEIGISTQKLHVRGPFALEGLTTYKWVIRGNGQIRES